MYEEAPSKSRDIKYPCACYRDFYDLGLADHDGAEPCSNSIACGNLLRLTTYLERIEFKDKAERLLSSFKETLSKVPSSIAEMVRALLHYHDSSTEVRTFFLFSFLLYDVENEWDITEIERRRREFVSSLSLSLFFRSM